MSVITTVCISGEGVTAIDHRLLLALLFHKPLGHMLLCIFVMFVCCLRVCVLSGKAQW